MRRTRSRREAVMTELKVAIVAGSTRPGRHSRTVADWVLGRAADAAATTMFAQLENWAGVLKTLRA
ncbi:NAD(P)H-dependent oxidoreductase [Rhodococcus oryzae]|uniref:NAD(P)H-dependent oxidoreductase n=1 Tax=Rhodococcus oryzae TaxID=2571143 RepID=UPI003723FFE5